MKEDLMKRKQFLIICFLMITILTAGYFTAYAMPLGQTEAAEETASESVIPVENILTFLVPMRAPGSVARI